MGILKDNEKIRNSIKGSLLTILQTLDDLNDKDCLRYIDWMQKKTALYRDGLQNNKYPPLPEKMERGDIVMCELGINVPYEFGNDGTGNHFVIVWGQQGHNLIVIPLTKQEPPKSNIHTIKLGAISGMPEPINYAKLDAIRTVSLRRIGKVYGQPKGKIVDKTIVKKINDAIKQLFVIEEKDLPTLD